MAIAIYFSLVAAEPIILGFQRHPGAADGRENYIYASFWTVVTVTALSTVIALIAWFAGYWREALGLIGWGLGIACNRLVATAWLNWQLPWRYAASISASTAVRTTVLVLLIVAGVDPVLGLGIAGTASAVIAAATGPRVRWAGLAQMAPPWSASFGLRLAWASLAFTVLTNGSLLVAAPFVSSDELGRFGAMNQFAAISAGAIAGLVTATVYPRLRAEWDAGRATQAAAGILVTKLWILTVGLAVIFASSLGDYWVVQFTTEPRFVDDRTVAALVAAATFGALGQASAWVHQFELNARRVAVGTTVAACLGIVATALLSWGFGIVGAALGALVGSAGYAAFMRAKGIVEGRTVGLFAAALVVIATLAAISAASSAAVAVLAAVALTASAWRALVATTALQGRSA